MTYYNEIAEGYNELHREEQLKKVKIILENIKIKEDDYLLDVGCGTGISSELFPCKKTGIDPSEELLKQAKIETVKASAEDIPFSDEKFDIVISITAIHNFNDIEKGLLEIERVGKDRFVFSILKKSMKKEIIEEIIKRLFTVKKVIEEEKDIIYFCEKK